ncbi:CoA pyrophosphatase [Flavobacterium sp. IMCC34852]|uniref:CoA pyrophosphatase n=1 Tax=Flavobacterium rivulicola TaxID=2732161 RepID=A0A7Y3VZ02_9FLAO|nr:CoA pyrophosphatase [Flavobacterium sp. IMCC34852]NNT72228.1 CoA pyrophosphatase [Flavobacterium sp. IMCC34852]
MHFEEFLKYTPKIQNVALPATLAHAKMAPANRLDLIKATDFSKVTPKQAAVLMLLYPKASQTHLALILRTSYNGVHSSQIAFPGGKVEDFDADLSQTALRETHEEIGVHPNSVNVIRAFTEVYIPPSNFMVYPYLGYSESELEFILQEDEVAGLVEFPFADFMDDSIIVNTTMKTSYAGSIEVPGFQVKEHFVWGATAMMLSELKDTLKLVL